MQRKKRNITGGILKFARQYCDVKLYKLADGIGVSRQHIARVENESSPLLPDLENKYIKYLQGFGEISDSELDILVECFNKINVIRLEKTLKEAQQALMNAG